jgi:hypothetical protein
VRPHTDEGRKGQLGAPGLGLPASRGEVEALVIAQTIDRTDGR